MQKPKRDHLDASFLQKKKSFTWYWQKELRNIPRLWIYFLNLNNLLDQTEVLHTWYSLQNLFKNMQNLFNKYAEEREFHYSLPFWVLPKHVENPFEYWFPSKYPFKFQILFFVKELLMLLFLIIFLSVLVYTGRSAVAAGTEYDSEERKSDCWKRKSASAGHSNLFMFVHKLHS